MKKIRKKKKVVFARIAIIGVGLIGGSIGLAAKKRKIAGQVIGFFRKRKSASLAKKLGIIDKAAYNFKDAVGNADLVILATPVEIIKNVAAKVINSMKPGSILIDVGSSKLEILDSIERLLLNRDISFIGTHPLAGSERQGLSFSRADLFDKSICFLTPGKNLKAAAMFKTKKFWQLLGADVFILNASIHDRIVAEISHMPHMISFALMDCIRDKYLPFSGTGLRDCTRLASSSPTIWRDICLSNRREILQAISRFKQSLTHLEKLLIGKDAKSLQQYLRKAKKKRDSL